MRKIIAATFVSLDGIMQAPGGPDEDPTGGFAFGGWTFPYFDEEAGEVMGEMFQNSFDLLLGRKTYDIFASHWPKAGDDDPIGGIFNRIRKYVATRSTKELTWNNSQSLGKDIVAALREIKSGDGPFLLIQGSSDMVQTLLEAGLIDEFNLLIYPVLLGTGKRLFGTGTMPQTLQLQKSKVMKSGVILANYTPAGSVKTGSFALEEAPPEELARRRDLD